MRVQLGHLHAAERKTLAARQHRDRDLAQFGRREHEFHVRRRFLQRFQQRVEGVAGQHVHFVDDEDLGAGLHRAETRGLDNFAHVVHAGAGRRVHFDDVGVAVGEDADAVGAYAARIRRRPAVSVGSGAVQRAGDDAGGGGFADTAHAREHERVRDPAGGKGIAQDAHHRLLADQVVERGRPVFAGKDAVRRGVDRFRNGGRGRVAEQARTLGRRGRGFVFGLIAEQAGHAGLFA